MSKVELNSVARIEPIIGPSLRTLSGAAHPTPDHIAVARHPIQVSIRGIVKSVAIPVAQRVVRVAPLGPQIQFSESREHRDVNSCSPHRPLRVSIRPEDDLILRKPITVERQPFAKFWNPV